MSTVPKPSAVVERRSPRELAQIASVPFPGLRPFFEPDAPLFYGRGAQIRSMLTRLRACRFLAVVGTSGCGKSSLVHAGLIPAVRRNTLGPTPERWRVIKLRPGNAPMQRLAEALVAEISAEQITLASSAVGQESYTLLATRKGLEAGRFGLPAALEILKVSSQTPVLVLVDQFEELFRFHTQETLAHSETATPATKEGRQNQAQAFVKLLLAAAAQNERPISVVLTMRSDYLGDCSLYSGLPEAINDAQFLTPQMSREQMRTAITGPLELFGAEADPAVVDQMLNDVEPQSDPLPLLQHALLQTWSEACHPPKVWQSERIALTFEHYSRAGGVHGALNQHLNRIFAELKNAALGGSAAVSTAIPWRTRWLGSLGGWVTAERELIDSPAESPAENWWSLPRHDVARNSQSNKVSVPERPHHTSVSDSAQDVSPPIVPRANDDDSVLRASKAIHRVLRPIVVVSGWLLSSYVYWLRRAEWLLVEPQLNMRPVPTAQQVCERMFRTLSDVNESGQSVRRLANVGDLAEIAGVSAEDVIAVARPFLKHGCTFLVALPEETEQTPLSTETTLDISHEALLRQWKRCHEWIEREQRRGSEFDQLALSERKNKTLTPEELNQLAEWRLHDRPNATWARIHLTADRVNKLDPRPPCDLRVSESAAGAPMETSAGTSNQAVESDAAGRSDTSDRSVGSVRSAATIQPEAGGATTTPGDAKAQAFAARQARIVDRCKQFVRTSSWRQIRWSVFPWAAVAVMFAIVLYVGRLKHVAEEAATKAERSLEELKTAKTERDRSDFVASKAREDTIKALEDSQRNLAIADLRLYANQLDTADREYTTGNFVRAQSCLSATHWDLAFAKWEYRHLALRLYPKHDVLTGHLKSVWSVAFSPDGMRLASASADHTIRVWDAATGQTVQTLAGHTKPVNSVAFNPDGTELASASDDKTICVWDVATWKPLRTLTGHTSKVTSVAFSPDGTQLASGSDDDTIRVWDAATGDPVRTLTGHKAGVRSVAFSPDGTRLASGGSEGTIRVWDAATGDPVRTLTEHTDGVRSVVFSPDGTRLASGSSDGTIRVWDAATGEPVWKGNESLYSVYCVAFSPDGTRLAIASLGDTIRVWNAATGNPLRTLAGHTDGVWSVVFSADGTRLASASLDRTIRVWDAVSEESVRTLTGHTSNVTSVAFRPDGTQLASASADQTIRVWDAATGQTVQTLAGHTKPVNSVAFNPDGTELASASDDKTICVWDAATWKPLRTLTGHTRNVTSVAFSRDGTQIASASADQTIRVWDVATGEAVRTLTEHKESVNSVAFSRDGTRLASASADQTIRMWDAATWEPVRTLKGHKGSVNSVAFSRDGTRLASASADQTIRVWDVLTGESMRTLTGHTSNVTSVAFSHDGTRLASASLKEPIWIWDTATGEPLRTLTEHSDGSCVIFSPDGERLVSANANGTIHASDAATDDPIRVLTGHTDGVYSVAFSPDGARLASASLDKTIHVWNAATGGKVRTLEGHTALVNSVAFSPDSKRLASASSDETIRVWDVATGGNVWTLEGHTKSVNSVAFSRNGTRLASASDDNTVRVWDAVTGKSVRTLIELTSIVTSVAFSPDGTRLASASDDKTICVWDVATWKPLRTLTGHTSKVTSVAFSPDGTQLAGGSDDDTIRVWDAATGDPVRTLTGHTAGVRSVAFSLDGTRLASGGSEGTIRVWDAATGDPVRTLIGHTSIVRSVAFSPDGTRLASAGADLTIRVWFKGRPAGKLSSSSNWH